MPEDGGAGGAVVLAKLRDWSEQLLQRLDRDVASRTSGRDENRGMLSLMQKSAATVCGIRSSDEPPNVPPLTGSETVLRMILVRAGPSSAQKAHDAPTADD